MRELTIEEEYLYQTLQKIEGDIAKADLCTKLGWTEQQFLDVAVPMSDYMKKQNVVHVPQLAAMIASRNERWRTIYFSNPLVDLFYLLENKLIELNSRPAYQEPAYQAMVEYWRRYRGRT